jgi:hypothetical protein
VKVKDVIHELNTKGSFRPPQIFIKFHGYVMFEIREKPMTLNLYRDTDHISLFELFFSHYSSIFLKRDNFCQYLVGKDQDEYFGWVYLNHNKCEAVYLKLGEKAVFFHSAREGFVADMEYKIWNSYYRKYQDIWKKDSSKGKAQR